MARSTFLLLACGLLGLLGLAVVQAKKGDEAITHK
jgi:hypothetical protein